MSERGRPFEPGNQFGQGRPPGSKNKKSLLLQEMLLDHGEEIMLTLIKRAKKGDRAALALCVERLIPPLKEVAELPVEQSQQPQQRPMELRVVFVPSRHKAEDSESAEPDRAQLAPVRQEDGGSRPGLERREPRARLPVPSGSPWS
jgi:hypothetical protein